MIARRRPVCPTLSIRVHPGAEPWAPDDAGVQRLACLLSRHVSVDVYHRSQLPGVWWAKTGRKLTHAPHSFRAWSNDGHAVLLVDGTETPESIVWLLAHELAHIELGRSCLLRRAYRSIPKPAAYLDNDDAHEAYPEEGVANQVADQIAPLAGGRSGLNRRWWRRRVKGRSRA